VLLSDISAEKEALIGDIERSFEVRWAREGASAGRNRYCSASGRHRAQSAESILAHLHNCDLDQNLGFWLVDVFQQLLRQHHLVRRASQRQRSLLRGYLDVVNVQNPLEGSGRLLQVARCGGVPQIERLHDVLLILFALRSVVGRN